MKKLYILFFFWVLSLSLTKAQTNLVPNGGFEIHDTCPTNVGQFNYVSNWSTLLNSPDYYNSCAPYSTTPNSSSPYNFFGYQKPATGNGYAGFWVYDNGSPTYREFIGAILTSPLIIGQKYYVSFKLNLTLGYNSNLACDKTGLRFANIMHTQSNPPAINNIADIYAASIITDSSNWTTIFDSFIADSAYSFIEVGNFFDTPNTNFITEWHSAGSNQSYYYVDDVCVSTDSLYSLNWTDTNSITGISKYNLEQNIRIYPNPSTTGIFYTNTNLIDKQIAVYDLLGNAIENLYINNNTIDLGNLENGIYFIIINNRPKQKIIINK
jgi:hypothetical protein